MLPSASASGGASLPLPLRFDASGSARRAGNGSRDVGSVRSQAGGAAATAGGSGSCAPATRVGPEHTQAVASCNARPLLCPVASCLACAGVMASKRGKQTGAGALIVGAGAGPSVALCPSRHCRAEAVAGCSCAAAGAARGGSSSPASLPPLLPRPPCPSPVCKGSLPEASASTASSTDMDAATG